MTQLQGRPAGKMYVSIQLVAFTPIHQSAQTEDAVWAIVFATAPSRVTLRCNTMRVETSVPTGVSSLKLSLVTPGQITASMVRSSDSGDGKKTIIDFSPNGFEFKLNPRTYNFNALVVASP